METKESIFRSACRERIDSVIEHFIKSKEISLLHILTILASEGMTDKINDVLNREERLPPLETVLFEAVKSGRLEIVKILVRLGADFTANKNYSIRKASERGYLEIVKYLAERGANVREDDDYAMRWAAKEGHLPVVKYLIEKGSDPESLNRWALRWAKMEDRSEVVEYFNNYFRIKK